MKNLALLCVLLTLAIISTCRKEDKQSDYPLNIEKIDGIIHVTNPDFPKNGTRVLSLLEEISIGDEDNDNYLLARPWALTVDDLGSIYVLDRKLCHVKVFDKEGHYLRTFSRGGQGPGELLSPAQIEYDRKNGQISILDSKNRKISHYRRDGTFVSDLKLNEVRAYNFYIAADGMYTIFSSNYDEARGYHMINAVLMSEDGNVVAESGNLLSSEQKIVKIGDIYTAATSPFDPEGHFVCTGDGMFYGFSSKYEIYNYGINLKKNKVIKKPFELIEISQKEKEDFIEYLKSIDFYGHFLNLREIPQFYPVFSAIWLDDKGRLLVKIPSVDGKIHFDVYDVSGVFNEKWILDYSIPDIPISNNLNKPVFKEGCVYCLAQDNNGNYFVKKYRLKEK